MLSTTSALTHTSQLALSLHLKHSYLNVFSLLWFMLSMRSLIKQLSYMRGAQSMFFLLFHACLFSPVTQLRAKSPCHVAISEHGPHRLHLRALLVYHRMFWSILPPSLQPCAYTDTHKIFALHYVQCIHWCCHMYTTQRL